MKRIVVARLIATAATILALALNAYAVCGGLMGQM